MRELFFADDVKPLPNIVADANTPPVVLLPGAMAMGGSVPAMPPVPLPMGAPGFPMMGGGMPMGPMGPMGPPGQMGGMGDFPMQMQMPPGERLLRRDFHLRSVLKWYSSYSFCSGCVGSMHAASSDIILPRGNTSVCTGYIVPST